MITIIKIVIIILIIIMIIIILILIDYNNQIIKYIMLIINIAY